MNYFFIGIKGSGMSALALILKDLGHEVSGSDVPKHFFTEKNLNEKKIKIYDFGQADISQYDVIILGNSFNTENADYKNAIKGNKKIVPYFNALNELATAYENVAVAGANGKTTVTGLLAASFANEEISYLIGDGTGKGSKNAKKFFFEACEYKNTFLNYHPKISIINNIEFDHPDFFENIDDMVNTFQNFANNSSILVINGDDENCQKIKHSNKYTFGLNSQNDLYADEVIYSKNGIKFQLHYEQKNLGEYTVPFYGEYMLLNILGVILVNLLFQKPIENVIENIATYKGASRRLSQTVLSKEKKVYLIDDYAHHPSSIRETLKAIRQKYPTAKVISLFQAHTKSREKTFATQFALELIKSDYIFIAKTFKAAREREDFPGEEELIIKEEIIKLKKSEKIIPLEAISGKEENTIICLFGAGDIDLLYKEKIINIYK